MRTALVVAVLCSAVASTAAVAGPQWQQFSNADGALTFLDLNTKQAGPQMVQVRVMRSYDKPINLGKHPETGEAIYRHGSVKMTYTIDCAEGVLALVGWQMYSGSLGDGEVVWADNVSGQVAFDVPLSIDERFALTNGCALRAAAVE